VGSVRDEVLSFSAQHGLMMRMRPDADPTGVGMVHVPVSLLPAFPIPSRQFSAARDLAKPFNRLVERIASDPAYLDRVLGAAADQDDFTRKLLEIHRKVEGMHMPSIARRNLAIHRSDYMLDEATQAILQVELNTISSSFGAHSTLVARLHRHILSKFDLGPGEDQVPYHDTTGAIVDAFASAVEAYPSTSSGQAGELVVLMVVQEGERNILDQQIPEHALWHRHGIRTVRKTLTEIAQCCQLTSDGRLLILDPTVGNGEVAVTYLRAGYGPGDYPSKVQWQARSMLEQSKAFKCPSIAYQLVGCKKVQQNLAEPGVLERFTDSRAERETIRNCFAGLWSLENLSRDGGSEGDATTEFVHDALANPENYVLKPQREGGGNNVYGEDLKAMINEGGDDLSAYILMQRIKPSKHTCHLLFEGRITKAETVSELGIYGVYLSDNGREVVNECCGALVRTKLSSSDEGGVTSGHACLSSPLLI